MGKHKKKLRQEKSKVQLKKSEKTKFLPKGQNVTNTTFKIKPIVLPEQLKEKDKDVPLSKRQLDVKDLTQRMKHYNKNVRHSACIELADMVKYFHVEIINNHLAIILQTVSPLIQDQCVNVRRSSVKVINNILGYTNSNKIEPFFSFMSINLRCAMTNINKIIQEDSLLLLDVLLKHTPKLVAKNAQKLLPDFFTLISKLRSDSQVGKTLTVNLGSKLTSVKWRLKVLSRLFTILNAIIEDGKTTDCTINKPGSLKRIPLSSLTYSFTFNDYQAKNQNNDEKSVLNKHLLSLVPLLYETWIEVIPEKTFKTESTTLNDESSAVLACIMKILYTLWNYTKNDTNISREDIFLTPEGRKFFEHLLKNFPYSQGEKLKEKSMTKSIVSVLERNDDPKCVEQNLLICYIYCGLNLYKTKKDQRIQNIIAYVTKCLLSNHIINSSNIKFLVLILRSILVEDANLWKKRGVKPEDILETVIVFYNNSKLSETAKMEIFSILVDVSDNDMLKSLPKYDDWMAGIVKELMRPQILSKKIAFLLSMSKRNNGEFNKTFIKNLEHIFGHLKALKIPDVEDQDSVKKDIINILFYLPLDNDCLYKLKPFANADWQDNLVTHVQRILKMKEGFDRK